MIPEKEVLITVLKSEKLEPKQNKESVRVQDKRKILLGSTKVADN